MARGKLGEAIDRYREAVRLEGAAATGSARDEGLALACYGLSVALDRDGELISAAQRTEIERLLAALHAKLPGSDHRAIKQAADALNRATEEFASLRMDANVRKALAGRRIADLER